MTTHSNNARTVLLVFIHGFRGTNSTFQDFPDDLSALLTNHLQSTSQDASIPRILTKVYPAFETRGDLKLAVDNLRDWLTNTVIDLEVQNNTHNPTVEPSVHVVLVGHSMGGIVAAECVLGIAQDSESELHPVHAEHGSTEEEQRINDLPSNKTQDASSASISHDKTSSSNTSVVQRRPMFPHVTGILAFDTPYLGISPGVIAHGAEEHYNTGRKWFDTASTLFGAGAGAAGASASTKGPKSTNSSDKATTEQPAPATTHPQTAWQKWGRAALIGAVTTTAVAGAAGAAWMGRESIGQGWTWASDHLAFIGTLARQEELKRRVTGVVALRGERGIGWANVYTVLGSGDGKSSGSTPWAKQLTGEKRTFCIQPGTWKVSSGDGKQDTTVQDLWFEARNEKQSSEVDAHCYMFAANTNSGYDEMTVRASQLIESWLSPGTLAPTKG